MPDYTIYNRDFREVFNEETKIEADTWFADPPDCIGLEYDEYDDDVELEDYIDFIDTVLTTGINTAKISYMSFNAKWMTEVGALLKAYQMVYPTIQVRWLIQGFTFGQHSPYDHGNNFRPIVRLKHRGVDLQPDQTRVESKRMKLNDKRASPEGRVPGDVWFSDFMEYSRVVGNAKQRRKWHPTQLNEGLVEACLLMSTPVGGTVVDPFMGTGTTLRVCKENDWSCITSDISENYCDKVAEEHNLKVIK